MSPSRSLSAAAWVFSIASAATHPLGAGQEHGGIIAKLSPDDYQAAMACGREGAVCAVEPYRLCPSDAGPFSATLATPFSRVASGAFESARQGGRPHTMDRGAATAWGVGIYVYPADGDTTAVIKRVYLQRGDTRVAPLTATVAPFRVPADSGTSRELARGFFSFPPSALLPDRPVTIVFVTSQGESRCSLSTSQLARLR